MEGDHTLNESENEEQQLDEEPQKTGKELANTGSNLGDTIAQYFSTYVDAPGIVKTAGVVDIAETISDSDYFHNSKALPMSIHSKAKTSGQIHDTRRKSTTTDRGVPVVLSLLVH